ncbi:uncharacterized protein LOC119120543 [Syngnathus acus]|uniref:uncharacterized protein LOC119120543 n=1 Tax=Syngnathus acus TaxID=161584 RepID=UPI00188616A9|nr:uncharacterized protein LOC119120543 [Syngnathus acus]
MLLIILTAVLLLAGLSAPLTDCDTLTQQVQIQSREQFFGTWTFGAESSDIKGTHDLGKIFVRKLWGRVYPSNQSDHFYAFQVFRMTDTYCYSITSKLTLVNNTVHMEHPLSATEVLLKTSCPDCILFLSNTTIGEHTYRFLQILTKRPSLTSDELEEFKQQAACLNFNEPIILGPPRSCPDSPDTKIVDFNMAFIQSTPRFKEIFYLI